MTPVSHSMLRQLSMLLLCVFALGAVLCAGGCGKKAAPPDPIAQMTKTDFQSKMASVKEGMTYEEVVTLLGGVQGKDVTMPAPPNAPENAKNIKQYQWVDDNRNMLLCYFQNNKLVWKNVTQAPPAQ